MNTQLPASRMTRGDRIQFAAGTVLFAAVAMTFAGYLTITGYSQTLVGGFLTLAGAALVSAVVVSYGAVGPQPVPVREKAK
jgi:hypothetical protein